MITLPGDFETYPLQYHPVYYKYQNNKFIVNNQKINEEEQDKQAKEAAKLKKEQDKASAKVKLKDLGLTDEKDIQNHRFRYS